jgi:preprotein translocase subunit SecY
MQDPQYEQRQRLLTIAIYTFTAIVFVVSFVGIIWGRELGFGGPIGMAPWLFFLLLVIFVLFIARMRTPRI